MKTNVQAVAPGDPRIAVYRDMADAALMRDRGLFVAEGRLVVKRVLEDGRFRVQSLLVNDAALHDLADAIARLPGDASVYACRTEDFAAITGFNIHRGCLALVERPPAATIAAVAATAGPLVLLEALSNADNVGGVFRSAAALGASGIVLSPTSCDPLYRKAIRTSMGAVLGVPFARSSEWLADIACLRDAGFTIAAFTPRQPSLTLDEFVADPRASRVALVVGAEGAGLAAETEAAADVRVRIPIRAAVDSLNVAVAASIALYALRR